MTPPEPYACSDAWPWPVKVLTLGSLELYKHDQPVMFPSRVQRKPLGLLTTLIAFGGRRVREQRLIDALWADAPGDKGRFALTTAIHRLRRLLGDDAAILRQDSEVSVNTQVAWVDAMALQTLLERAEAMRSQDTMDWDRFRDVVTSITRLHRGPFLADNDGAPYAVRTRKTLETRVLAQIMRLGQHLEPSDPAAASELYEQARNLDPCSEDACRHLMMCYQRLGRAADRDRVYDWCRESLAAELAATPSPETQAVWRRLRYGAGLHGNTS